jgi:GTPase
VLVDGPVSPVQQRNLEKEWGVKLLDRTGLILEIFRRPRPHPRGRVAGGTGRAFLSAHAPCAGLDPPGTPAWRFRLCRRPGETQIEADRRAIDDQVIRIRRQLDKVVKTRELHRAARRKVPFPIVALVGYTNAGKSTLFNRMTGAEVLAKDMLFATLDPTMRGITLPSGRKIILSDTVGFISDLPTQLVAAFRATLEEVLEADLILHVRDISHPETAEQAADVADILASLGVRGATPPIEVWNKLDLVTEGAHDTLTQQAQAREGVFAVSALTGEGLDRLLDAVSRVFDEEKFDRQLRLTFAEGRKRAWLHDEAVVMAETQDDSGWTLELCWTARQEKRFRAL